MAGLRKIAAGAAVASLTLIAGCSGKPEDTGSAPDATDTKAPPPALPSWAGPLLGHQLSEISKGTTTCKGKIDVVTARHTGKVKGSEVQGWAWDEGGSKPFAKVVFTTPSGKIIGAAEVGQVRKDVVNNLPEVKTPNVGWSGVINIVEGPFRAQGLSAGGAACLFDNSAL